MDKTPYGDVSYADPGYQKDGKKRYPVDTKEHVTAAWEYINHEAEAAKYSSEQLDSIKSKIKEAAKKFGVEINDSDADDKSESKSSESAGAAHEGTPAETRTNDDAGQSATS